MGRSCCSLILAGKDTTKQDGATVEQVEPLGMYVYICINSASSTCAFVLCVPSNYVLG